MENVIFLQLVVCQCVAASSENCVFATKPLSRCKYAILGKAFVKKFLYVKPSLVLFKRSGLLILCIIVGEVIGFRIGWGM